MAPIRRIVPQLAAEPPQDGLPYGRWADRLGQELLAACLELEGAQEDLGEPGEILWYPDRSWHGRTYVPATSTTSEGHELFGYVRFLPGDDGAEPSEFWAHADFTDQTAAANPQWRLDLCDEVIGRWRGPDGDVAAMTLVWGRPLIGGGSLVTAELDDLAVDQCQLIESRFTLIAPDDYRQDLLDIKLWSPKGAELARESLYEGDDAEGDDTDEDDAAGDEGR
jgi:hypothetical protein